MGGAASSLQAGDHAALARRIEEVMSSPELRQSMGRFGREKVRECFTFEAQAKAYVALFERLLARRPAG